MPFWYCVIMFAYIESSLNAHSVITETIISGYMHHREVLSMHKCTLHRCMIVCDFTFAHIGIYWNKVQ